MPIDLSGFPPLADAYAAYQRELSTYVAQHRLYWSAKLHLGGTLSNAEAGLMFAMGGGFKSLANGCIQLQQKTFITIQPLVPADWLVRRWRVGSSFGHSAVYVYERGGCPVEGYMFDAWLAQCPLVYGYDEWLRATRMLSIFGKAHPQ